MIEFMLPGREFRATGSDESPGRERFDKGDKYERNNWTDYAVQRLQERYLLIQGD